MIDIVTVTTLFPSSVQPRNGLFVAERLRRLVDSRRVRARVIAPVPWFPSAHPRFGRYAVHARVAPREWHEGMEVLHPRFLAVPRIGEALLPLGIAAAVSAALRRIRQGGGRIDLIDAQFLYPDAVGATLAARALGVPVVLTARGSDVNDFATRSLPRRMIRWAVRNSGGVIAVSNALADSLAAIGIARDRITVLRNGVDLERFRPEPACNTAPPAAVRPRLLSVGNLLELKGHHLAIEALELLADVELLIVGEGPQRAALEELARRRGVADRVTFAGGVPPERMADMYRSAFALVLASRIEGMPNVVLESLACGTPVIATAVGGIPEVIREPAAGVLMSARSAAGLAEAYRTLVARRPARSATRQYAEQFAWEPTIEGQLQLFEAAVTARAEAGGRDLRQNPEMTNARHGR